VGIERGPDDENLTYQALSVAMHESFKNLRHFHTHALISDVQEGDGQHHNP
jgi:hypothetical protein